MEISNNQNSTLTLQSKVYKMMTDEELENLLQTTRSQQALMYGMLEDRHRKNKLIADLEKRVSFLESKTLKKAGRKKKTFNFDGKELTDDYLVYLIDYDLATIGKLEKIVGAGKNVLRNRYKKAKRKLLLERQVKRNDNS